MELFRNQKRALEIIHTADHGIFQHICGSGKSLIYKTAARRVDRTLILVPRKVLVEQFYQDYFVDDDTFDVIKINSDQKKLNGLEAGFWSRFKVSKPEKPLVALVNYQSLNRLLDGLGDDGKYLFDLVFADEAHHVNGDGRMMNRLIQGKSLGKKTFFFTATPNEVMLTRSDIFGPILDIYTFAEAVKDGIVKTFTTHIECLDQNPDSKNTPLLWSIGQFILKQGLTRVVVYVNSIQEGRKNSKRPLPADDEDDFQDLQDEEEDEAVEDLKKTKTQKRSEQVRASMALNTFQKEALKTLPRGIKVDYITAKTSLDQRYHMFRKFRDEEDKSVRVIVSCKTISEGVDLSSTDAVILLDSRSNNITTTQRILRCTRLTRKERSEGTWKPAVVLIPIANYSVQAYRQDDRFREWLDQFAQGLKCRFKREEELDEDNSSFPLPLLVGDNVDDIPYDPRERTDDPIREKVATFLQSQIPDMNSSDAWTLERGIFDFTCQMSNIHTPAYSRNWDSPYFVRIYKNRTRSVAADLKLLWKTRGELDLYKFSAQFTKREMNDEYHAFFEMKEKEALESNANASVKQFMQHGWKEKQQKQSRKYRTGIKCNKCLASPSKEEDLDYGYQVECTQLQIRSSDESATNFYYCPSCGSRWKGED